MLIDFNDLSTVTLFMLCRYDCILCNFIIINPSSEGKKKKNTNLEARHFTCSFVCLIRSSDGV